MPVLPSESLFFVAANAGFPLERFFVGILLIVVRLVVVWRRLSGIENVIEMMILPVY